MRFPLQLGMAIVAVSLLAGCARHYNIRTNNGGVITAKGKPKFDKPNGVFVYQDANGVERRIAAGSVQQIAPASDSSSPTRFNPK
jgi:hypothetical protein